MSDTVGGVSEYQTAKKDATIAREILTKPNTNEPDAHEARFNAASWSRVSSIRSAAKGE